MFDLAKQISSKLDGVFVTPAFLDGTPDVREIIADVEQDEVFVIPFMASQGYYTDVVFRKAFAHERKTVQFAQAIGAQPELVPLVDDRITKLIDMLGLPNDVVVLIVGHGTRKNKNSCRTTVDLVKAIRSRRPEQRIEFAFIDQNPNLDFVASRLDTEQVLIIPFLMGLGPHTTDDVPEAFGITEFRQHVFESGFEFPYVHQSANRSVPARYYDAPLGTYPELAGLCVDLFHSRESSSLTLQGTLT